MKPTDYRSDEYPGKARLSADSEGLGAWGNERLVVGHVPEVNGSEACEVPQFVTTQHELIQIAKYWIGRILDNDFFFFTYAQTGSTEWRINSYADRRINRAAEFLSEQEFNELMRTQNATSKINIKSAMRTGIYSRMDHGKTGSCTRTKFNRN